MQVFSAAVFNNSTDAHPGIIEVVGDEVIDRVRVVVSRFYFRFEIHLLMSFGSSVIHIVVELLEALLLLRQIG